MTILADQDRSNPDRPGLTRLLPKLPHSAGWMLLVNLLLGSLFFLELQWYLEHVYRFSPWIPFLSYERVHTVIDVLWGAFMLHVGAPLARGKLEILTAPEKFLGKEAFGLFSHRTTAAAVAALVVGLYALITFSPALHLIHTSTGDAPVVVIDGSRRQFDGSSLPLLGREMDVDQAEVVVSGRHRFLRVNLDPVDVETYRLFPTHKHVDLERFFLRRDLLATLYDAHDKELASFTFQHENDLGITRQCGESDIQRLFPDDPRACVTLMRRIVADMSANTDARLLRDFEGAVEYKGRIYGYNYEFGPELELSIRAPEAQSEFASTPQRALARFRSAASHERELLVSEFVKDVGSLSSAALENVFQELFSSARLVDYFGGTRSQRIDSLMFTKDVLSLGVDHVALEKVDELVMRILDRNLSTPSDEAVLVPAIGAVIGLSRGASSLRAMVLDRVGELVASFETGHSASKSAIAGVLLEVLGDGASASDNERILGTLGAIRRSVSATGPAAELIDSQFRERLGEVSDPAIAAGLREAMFFPTLGGPSSRSVSTLDSSAGSQDRPGRRN